ncbi:replication initiator protein A protein [Streptococcus mutans OMZ175]|nr:replication initiator protein A protein [Streptococcus mutans OMZ175]
MKRITANQYQTSERYYKLPKVLFESERYKDMKLEVKVAYAVLKDRLELSLSKGWIDEDGAIYLIYSNSNLMALLGCSKSKLLSIKKTLREYGLIDEVQQSSSEKGRMANKIYLGELEHEPTPVLHSDGASVKKTLGGAQRKTGPVLNSAPSETEESETKYSEIKGSDFLIEDEEERQLVDEKQEENFTSKVDGVTNHVVVKLDKHPLQELFPQKRLINVGIPNSVLVVGKMVNLKCTIIHNSQMMRNL